MRSGRLPDRTGKRGNYMIPNPAPYIANFESLALGLFIHVGPYTRYEHGEWAFKIREMSWEQYEKDARSLDWSGFDLRPVLRLARQTGMRYAVLSTRHHDGFSLYDTCGLNDFDVMHTPNGRDLVAEFVTLCREEGLVPFLYHTTLDWYEPSFEKDFAAYQKYLRASVELLCTRYGKLGGLWFDGNWSRPSADWELDALYGMIRTLQPEAIITNNTGLRAQGVAVHPEIDCVTFEQGAPRPMNREGAEKYVAGEKCCPMNRHWGLAHDCDYKSVRELLAAAFGCRGAGMNLLLNVSPDLSGRIPTIQWGLLEEMGKSLWAASPSFYTGRPCGVESTGSSFALETPEGNLTLFIDSIDTYGNMNVMLPPLKSFCAFSGVTREVKKAYWNDDGAPLEYTQDLERGLLYLRPALFPYGENRIWRTAELIF